MRRPAGPVRLGLRANAAQFSLLVGVNALVGGMVGQERTVLPLLATREFGLHGHTAALTFLVAFGIVKAVTNLFAGALADRVGRKPVLVAGWLAGLPVPVLLMLAPSWSWVVLANVLLGVNQGLAWSTTVVMKIDLVGARQRGTAMGLNEAAGYVAVAAAALTTGLVAAEAGLRPEPFYLGVVLAGLGLGLSVLLVADTSAHVAHEAAGEARPQAPPSLRSVFVLTSFRDRALSAVTQAGLVNNLNDGVAWGLLPVLFTQAGLSLSQVGVLVALYPAVWGLGQLVSGALSDRWGRKWLIATGMEVQAIAIAATAATTGFVPWAASAVGLGVGTALVYPTLLAAVGDVAQPRWRASCVGVYRLWRDSGFAVGALLAGAVADLLGIRAAVWAVALLTGLSGAVVAVRMYETHPRSARRVSPPSAGAGPPVPATAGVGGRDGR